MPVIQILFVSFLLYILYNAIESTLYGYSTKSNFPNLQKSSVWMFCLTIKLIIYRLILDFKLNLKSVSLYLLKADYMNLPLSNNY